MPVIILKKKKQNTKVSVVWLTWGFSIRVNAGTVLLRRCAIFTPLDNTLSTNIITSDGVVVENQQEYQIGFDFGR